MKTFKQMIAEVAQPNNEDELNFKAKHSIEVLDHPVSHEHQHSAEKRSPRRRADYDENEDEEVYEAKLDPVGKEDDDIDNDGDTDSSDEYLHARRKAISRAMKKESKLDPVGKEDGDIDNDGDEDKSDEYLHNRRKAIAKAMRESIRSITEKAKSEAQQKAAAIALAVKRGDKPKSELIGASKEMYKMSEKDLEDFARTSHEGIPARVNEANTSKIIASLNAGDSIDVVVQKNLNKKGDNKDEILKVIRDYNWKKRMKKEEVGLDEAALVPQQRDRLDRLIDMVATVTHPEYIGNEDETKYINMIKKEFGEKVAKQIDDGIRKMHYGKDNRAFGTDTLANRARKTARVTSSGKMNKQDVKALKNRIISDKELWGGIAKKANLPEEFDLTEDANKMLAIGRKLQAMAAKEKNDMIANAMAKLADHLETFGAPFGPKNMADLVKKTGMKAEVITSLIKRANVNEEVEQITEDATLDKIRTILTKKNDGTKVVKDKSGYFHIKMKDSHKGPYHSLKDVLKDLSEEADLTENFKTGAVKLNDGSSVVVKETDAKLMNQLFKELSGANRDAMMKTAMKDKKGFNEILGFAKEAF